MTQTNSDRVEKALRILRDGLKPFVEQAMRTTYRELWLQKATGNQRQHQLESTSKGELSGDLQVLIHLMSVQWEKVFARILGDEKYSLLDELNKTRNRWAHMVEFSTDDACRALESIQCLLDGIAVPSLASEISRQNDELQSIRIEEQTHPGTNARQLELNKQLTTFTDRCEALALFDFVTTHNSSQLSPYFPILAFVAYGGSGKSTLINYLRTKECYSTSGQVLLPYAYLNFIEDNKESQDWLSILVALRNQLQRHRDAQGKPLTFPRFDLAASIALSVLGNNGFPPMMSKDQIIQSLSAGLPYIDIDGNMNTDLQEYRNLFQSLYYGISQNKHIKELQLLLERLEKSLGWRWHFQQNSNLGSDTDIRRILSYLYTSSFSSQQDTSVYDDLIKQQLPKALFADLKEAIEVFTSPQSEGKKTCAVIFLDGFEALMNSTTFGETNARHLLEMLSINQLNEGVIAPLLLVIGSRHELLELTETERSLPQNKGDTRNGAHVLYKRWHEDLLRTKQLLSLENLILPLELANFELDDTRLYLQRFDKREHTQIFIDEALIQAIHDVTQGYPLYVNLLAIAAQTAEDKRQPLLSEEIRKTIKDEHIAFNIIQLLLREFEERKAELITCSVPRSLDIATLRAIRPEIEDDFIAQERLDRYRRLKLLDKASDGKLVFHSIVREILQQELGIRDYYQTHTCLLEYFHEDDEQASLEEAYHALALGNPNLIIKLGIAAQQNNVIPWDQVVKVVEQAPIDLLPPNIEKRAYEALQRLHLYNLQDGVTAAILYTWLLTVSEKEPTKVADIQHALGFAYTRLSRGDRQANLERAIQRYERALTTYTKEKFPIKWALIQTDLSEAYCLLPGKDQHINWQKAVECCEYALQILTQESHPFEWATAKNNLGEAYSHSSDTNRRAYLEKAIVCYKEALTVLTQENRTFEWGTLQNNLGNAYCNLRGEANLLKAVHFYKEALIVRTYEQYPVSWATTKNNLGNAYRNLGDEEDLRAAIECYKEALTVRTRESYLYEWAMTQNNLGLVYYNLPQGKDRQANLRQAIQHYEDALTVRTRESYPYDWAATQNNLGLAYQNLQGKDRQANLRQAIQHYEDALTVYTRGKFQSDWAKMQNNIGNTYRDLLGEANLPKAIEHYEAALTVYTREDFPYDWAATQNNLGLAYRKLQDEASLRKAITYYEAALGIRTREAALVARAKTLKNLGDVYSEFQGKNRQENLSRAIKYYKEARNIFLSKQKRNDVGSINKKLREIREEL